MKYFFDKKSIIFYFSICLCLVGYAQQISINEVQSSNVSTIYDHTGNTPDWIEIYNAGSTDINLENYGLSDEDSLPLKWTFPSILLEPQRHLMVFVSDLNLKEPVLNWETIIDIGEEWKYILPSSEVASSWRNIGFNDADWLVGKSGFGYGDGDDSTIIEASMSVFIGKKFSISNVENFKQAYLHIDFDDGFVAYLNGAEIARSNIGIDGIAPAYDQAANNYDHEAAMYNGGMPDEFLIDSVYKQLLEGENVLAIQIHNHSLNSSDLTAIPIFTFGTLNKLNEETYISPYVNFVPLGLHTNFKISSEGEHIILSDPEGRQLDSIFTSKILGDISLGRKPDGSSDWIFFKEPTPGLSNVSEGYLPIIVEDVQFSIPGGLHVNALNVELSSSYPTDSIFYTIDGSEPMQCDQLYSSAIKLWNTTSIRARAIRSGHLPGPITTQTYLINESHNLPIVSVNTDPFNLWDNEYGIYAMGNNASSEFPHFGANFWEDWERPAHIAMYETDGSLAFQLDAGIKIFGAWSRGQHQKSISIHARKSFGADGINYKLFEEKDISKFETIILRNSGNDFNNTMLRDAYCNRIVSTLELDQQAYRPAIVYLNGEYWGIQNIREKVNEEFIAANHGIQEDQIDILEGNGEAVRGNGEHYEALLDYLYAHGMSVDENYNYVKTQIDIDNFIKYQLSEIFIDNRDWPGNNVKFWRERSPIGKWRWIMYDSDFGFDTWGNENDSFNTLEFALEPNGPGWPNPPWSTFLFRKLIENTSFKNDFINNFADNLNTIFQPNILEDHLSDMKLVIEPEIANHLSRWHGDMGYWGNRISVMKSFARTRQGYVRSHIKREFDLSGEYKLDLNVEGNGHVQLNTLSIKQFPWNGVYFNDVPIELEAIPDPGYKFVEWVGIETTDREHLTLTIENPTEITAVFMPSEERVNEVIINEINYNSNADFDPGDWVELLNVSDHSINVSGWIIKDNDDLHVFRLPEGTIINSHGFLVICRDKVKFSTLFPTVEIVAGELDFGFGSGGDCIRLFSQNNSLIDHVCYENNTPWPMEPNGGGASLALLNSLSNSEHPANWLSSVGHGTPGAKNTDIITGLNDPFQLDELMSVRVYPNPASKIVNIEIHVPEACEMTMSLIDMRGRQQKVIQNHQLSEGKNELTFNLSTLENEVTAGFYILMFETNSAKKRVKLLVH